MDVFSVSWLPEDQIEELCKVLNGASGDSVEKCLVEYVVDSIEPAGWRAVWRPDPVRTPPGAFRHNYALSDHQEYIVDVLDVSLEKLEADIQIVHSVSEYVKKLKTSPEDLIPESCKLESYKGTPSSEESESKDGTNDPCAQNRREMKAKRRDRKPTSVIITETKMQGSSLGIPMPDTEMDTDEQSDSDFAFAQNTASKNVDPSLSNRGEESGDHVMRALNETAGVKLADKSIVQARVWELTPLVQQENHCLDVETTAEVTALVRFFYEHIFYPWDAVAEFCCYDEATVADRHLLHQRLSGEAPGIPGAVAAEMHRAVRDAWLTLSAIDQLEASCGARRDGCELVPGDVQKLLKLHETLHALKEHFERLRNPVMRELSMQRSAELSMTHSSSGYDSLSCAPPVAANRVWLVGRCASVLMLQQYMQQLPDLVLRHYPQSVEWSLVLQSYLQPALDHSSGGDLVLLLPGSHLLNGLGALAVAGGALHGIGEGVIIQGGLGAGDVMMHIGVETPKATAEATDLCLRNLTLKPMAHQTALLVHSSVVLLDRCCVRDCRAAVIVATEPAHAAETGDDEGSSRQGLCKLHDCRIADCSDVGVDVREHSAVEALNTIVANCRVGLRVHARAKVEASGLSIKGSARCAVEMADVEPVDQEPEMKALPDGDRVAVLPRLHLAHVCSSHESVELTDNFCDVAAAAEPGMALFKL